MRNLKKVLSLALALVMLLGMMVVGAGAATDFKDASSIENTEAVDVVSGIGVLQGDENGYFNPEGTLTRAEAAVVVAKLDLGAAFGNLETTNASTFSDVPAGYWGKPYIDYCFARGLIAGVGNNKYNPNGKVTGVEFALMVSRVLGYEDKAEQVGGADWEVDAAALARKAGLTVDVTLGSHAMTRDEMAQVAYNALKADMVEYPNGSINIDVNGTPVTIGGNPAQAKKNDGVAQYDSGSTVVYNGATLQLCEEKFPLLKLSSDEDAFQRDTKLWTYGRDTIHESPTTADKTYTKGVQVKTIAKDLKVESGATCEIWVDGVKNFEGKIASATIKDSYITTGNGVLTEAWLYAGNEKVYDHVKITVIHTFVGKVTGVNTAKETVTVATQGTNIKDYTSTVNNKLVKTFKTTGYEIGDLVTFTAAYEAATTGKYDIQEMDHLELTATGTLNKWKGLTLPGADKGSDEASFTVADQDYEYSANYGVVNENGDDYTVYEFNAGKSEVNVYLDKYNYAIFVSGVEAEKNYAAVIGVGATNAYGSETKGVTLLFPDGTQKEVIAKSSDWGKMTTISSSGYNTFGKVDDVNNYKNLVTDGVADIVTYTVGDNDVYTLYLADNGRMVKRSDGTDDMRVYTSNYDPTAGKTGKLPTFVNGRSKIEIFSKYNGTGTNSTLAGITEGAKQTYYTTSKTIFMVATQKSSSDKYAGREYNVYTGYAEAPGFTTTDQHINGIAFVLNKQYPTQVDVVYIDAVETAGVTSVDAYFVINREYHQIATSSDGGIYELPAIVDGKEEKILIKANTEADWDRSGNASGDGKLGEIGNGLYAIKDVKKDKNGVIYSCTVQSGSGFYKAANGLAGTVKPNRIVMGIGPSTTPLNTEADLRGNAGTTYWAYNDKTSVYYVDKDYKTISVIEMETGVQTDLDDAVYATHDNATGTEKKLVDVIIVEDARKVVTYTVGASAHVEVRSTNAGWTGTATSTSTTFGSGDTVYVKAATGYTIDVAATEANGLTLTSVSSGVYSFAAKNVAADTIVAKQQVGYAGDIDFSISGAGTGTATVTATWTGDDQPTDNELAAAMIDWLTTEKNYDKATLNTLTINAGTSVSVKGKQSFAGIPQQEDTITLTYTSGLTQVVEVTDDANLAAAMTKAGATGKVVLKDDATVTDAPTCKIEVADGKKLTLNISGATLTKEITGAGNVTVSDAITSGGANIKVSGKTTVAAGVDALTAVKGDVDVTADATIGGALTMAAGKVLTITDNKTLTMTGAATVPGTITATATTNGGGKLILKGNDVIGSIDNKVNVTNTSGSLAINGTVAPKALVWTADDITVNDGAALTLPAATLAMGGKLNVSGTATLGGTTTTGDTAAVIVISATGDLVLNGQTLTGGGTTATITVAQGGTITGSGAAATTNFYASGKKLSADVDSSAGSKTCTWDTAADGGTTAGWTVT